MLTLLLNLALLALSPTSLQDPILLPTPAETATAISITREGMVMGTPWSLTLAAESRPTALAASEIVFLALAASELRLSNWNEDSELSRWNRSIPGEPFACSPSFSHELRRADTWRRITSGAFSPLTEPLVRAWDLRGSGRVPSARELAQALDACSPAGLTWMEDQPIRSGAALIASGGFGKGAALDAALNLSVAEHSGPISINLGGQVIVRACTETVGIAHPQNRAQAIAYWRLDSGSLATSGNSERSKEVNDQKIGHILDPRTGQPALDFGSVTVWCDNALDADCLSTAMFVLGPDKGMQLAASLKNVRVLFIENTADGLRLRATPNCQPYLTSAHPIHGLLDPQEAHNPSHPAK
ncbi:MAG: FAD:protein FMN transferase [Planctomycetes bacterium]|nr:FAD:protein FMN transferase [Planctomycetota bacterium]